MMVQQEDSEPCGYGGDSRGVLQFRENPQNAARHSGNGRWLERSRLSLEEIIEIIMMADSYMPKPGKRGPYKKQISN